MASVFVFVIHGASVSGPKFILKGLCIHQGHVFIAIVAFPVAEAMKGHVHVPEGTAAEFEIESVPVGTVGDV